MTESREAKKIIALVPVRNEAHIIETFLRLTLRFADHVIIADQGSTDRTRSIAEKFDSVTVLENRSALFDNAARSSMLIEAARKQFGDKAILFAIDADELYCPSPEAKREIETIKKLAEGTTLFIDKPSFIGSAANWIEYGPVFPLGYIDDGVEYKGTLHHSRRVPSKPKGTEYKCHAIKFAHLDALDVAAMHSKRRLYSIRERDAGDSSLRFRWKRNSPLFIRSSHNQARRVDANFVECFRSSGVNISELRHDPPLWWDIEALRRFHANGYRRYWWEDIWTAPWEDILAESKQRAERDMPQMIRRPPVYINLLRWLLIRILFMLYKLVGVWRRYFRS